LKTYNSADDEVVAAARHAHSHRESHAAGKR